MLKTVFKKEASIIVFVTDSGLQNDHLWVLLMTQSQFLELLFWKLESFEAKLNKGCIRLAV